ncbi:response regulator [Granulicella tundricola]|uniref:Two component transcriptional regulator, LuxR family n=1 Tax=Granulicella tundricola (strain ATCC BAA-1859 / DSM 23138 / MP5ACTX9) TaxID=1198114 RepID=E8WVE7_GRATM|nr:response regulator transcription factor [Granulicella tundricola]ADW68395.1 two component transcriptional regulator, LuxR family [Granulicella tundricola MP5ACTX9]
MTLAPILRILVVDDHPLMRSGIAGEINGQPDMRVVAEASDGEEAIAAFKLHRPDVTLMDLRMPGIGGIEAIRRIRTDFPISRFVVLTSSAGDVQVMRAFQAGATGYLLKNLLRTELIDTIRVVHAGRRRMPPELAQQIAEYAMEDAVSPRELEVLQEVSRGKSNKIVAGDLNISEHTVKNHLKSILSKLDASDRTDAVVIAIRRGYIEM